MGAEGLCERRFKIFMPALYRNRAFVCAPIASTESLFFSDRPQQRGLASVAEFAPVGWFTVNSLGQQLAVESVSRRGRTTKDVGRLGIGAVHHRTVAPQI